MRYLILQTVALMAITGCGSVQNSQEKSGYGHWDNLDSIESFELLEKSQCFRVGGIGVAGVTPPEEIALRRIMKQGNASTVLESLYSRGSSAGKLYAMLGLRFVNRAKYEELVPKLQQNTYKVDTQAGCIISEEKVQVVIKSMEAGNYDIAIQRELKSN